MNGIPLSGDKIWIEDRGLQVPEHQILATPRIGVAFAGEDAQLPYRFIG
jgi:DNA-3-methyladenine glycosylase